MQFSIIFTNFSKASLKLLDILSQIISRDKTIKDKHTFGVILNKVDNKRIDFHLLKSSNFRGLGSCHKRSLASSYCDSDIHYFGTKLNSSINSITEAIEASANK